MRGLVNGNEGGALTIYQATDFVLQVILYNDDGSVLDLTGGTFSFEVYAATTRTSVQHSWPGVLVTAAGGRGTVTVTPTLSDQTAGTTYYGYLKHTSATTKVYFALQYYTLTVK